VAEFILVNPQDAKISRDNLRIFVPTLKNHPPECARQATPTNSVLHNKNGTA
jgi:hypothetical protein